MFQCLLTLGKQHNKAFLELLFFTEDVVVKSFQMRVILHAR